MRKAFVVAILSAVVLSATPASAKLDEHSGDVHKTRRAVLIWTAAEAEYWRDVDQWVTTLQTRRAQATPKVRRVSSPSPTGGDRHYICPQFASSDNPTGDFAIPCAYIDRESDGDYDADNPRSSAYGAYQILHLPPGTPPAEQDAIARGMALCNWQPPNYCAGN